MIIFRKPVEFALCLIFLALTNTQGQTIKVTLLGTGTPLPVMERSGPSILVEAGEQKFLFDAGRGTLQRLTQINVKYREIQGVFFTHLHSDHVVGFPDLWLIGWLTGQRITPLKVWGPKGTKRMMSNLEKAFEFDIKIRISDDKASPDGVLIQATDIKESVVYEQNGVKITAFEVDHKPIEPAFGYRIDYAGRSVVLSGDTRFSENLIRYSKGVDLLIHEVASPQTMARMKYPPERAKGIVAHHTTPEQAGEIFSLVKPRMAIFSHIAPPMATEQEIIPLTRKNYAGVVELGEDLMVIEVGEKIEIRRPSAKTN
jgi:ribonuclease Z